MNDLRKQALTQWVEQQTGRSDLQLQVVSGDASFRRYFRAPASDGLLSVIAVDAPPEKEPIEPFVKISELLASTGVTVPRILAQDPELGFMLLSDFGDELYLSAINETSADKLYREALDALVTIQFGCQDRRNELPAYDHALLHQEMELFREWFLQQHLGLELTSDEHQMLDEWFETLSAQVLKQTQVAVHRDYHCRNLMVLPEHGPGIIDYQDAVWGPYSYDLVSLLKDCYIRWPREQQLSWLAHYTSRAERAGITIPNIEQRIRDYDWMGMQRHIKVAGIFCRLCHRDGKTAYLQDVPLTLGYLVEALRLYPEMSPYLDWMERRLAPVLQQKKIMWQEFD